MPKCCLKYPKWDVRGFESNKTFESQAKRKDVLDDIVRDVVILSKCHYLICGFSSNICRLEYELMGTKEINPDSKSKSLDWNYTLRLQSPHTIPNKIITV